VQLSDIRRPNSSVILLFPRLNCTAGSYSPTVTYFSARSFVVEGPKAWNQLSADIRAIDSVNSFKTALKTFLFCCWLLVYVE